MGRCPSSAPHVKGKRRAWGLGLQPPPEASLRGVLGCSQTQLVISHRPPPPSCRAPQAHSSPGCKTPWSQVGDPGLPVLVGAP